MNRSFSSNSCECPLCFEYFPASVLAQHAAQCQGKESTENKNISSSINSLTKSKTFQSSEEKAAEMPGKRAQNSDFHLQNESKKAKIESPYQNQGN